MISGHLKPFKAWDSMKWVEAASYSALNLKKEA